MARGGKPAGASLPAADCACDPRQRHPREIERHPPDWCRASCGRAAGVLQNHRDRPHDDRDWRDRPPDPAVRLCKYPGTALDPAAGGTIRGRGARDRMYGSRSGLPEGCPTPDALRRHRRDYQCAAGSHRCNGGNLARDRGGALEYRTARRGPLHRRAGSVSGIGKSGATAWDSGCPHPAGCGNRQQPFRSRLPGKCRACARGLWASGGIRRGCLRGDGSL